jgi:hypothetical protein
VTSKNLSRKQILIAAVVGLAALAGTAGIAAWALYTPVSRAPTDAECKKTEKCRTEGLCSAQGGACAAASNTDCAQSDACKKGGECVGYAGKCMTRSAADNERRARDEEALKQARGAASKAVAPWLAMVQSAAGGQQTSAALAATMATPQLDGFVVENSAPTLVAMEVGQATWNGKRLPAAIVRVTVPFVNRAAGERRAVCLVQAALHDEEFKMWRQMQTWGCQESGLADGVKQWRTTNGFASTQVWPAPPAPGVDVAPSPAPSASAASSR